MLMHQEEDCFEVDDMTKKINNECKLDIKKEKHDEEFDNEHDS